MINIKATNFYWSIIEYYKEILLDPSYINKNFVICSSIKYNERNRPDESRGIHSVARVLILKEMKKYV